MPGESDRLYIEARRALLDALEALAPHRDSLILVGAQAVYLHTGEADIAVAPYTKDADVAIDPRHLGGHPVLDDAMQAAGFELGDQPGIWRATRTMAQVDLLVPDTRGGPGRHRGAQIEGHGRRAARRVAGIEGALVDNASMSIGSLEASDTRRIELRPGDLLVVRTNGSRNLIGRAALVESELDGPHFLQSAMCRLEEIAHARVVDDRPRNPSLVTPH